MKYINEFITKYRKYLIFIIPFSLYAGLIAQMLPDSDTWFLYTTGEYIVENGFPTINPFVIHENYAIVIQQWLFDVFIYFLYGTFSEYGLYAYCLFMFAASMLLLYKYLGYFTKSPFRRLFIMMLSAYCQLYFVSGRPVTATYAVMLIWLILLEERRAGNKRAVYFLPLLSLFEINVHASMWAFLFVLALPYFFDGTYIGAKETLKRAIRENKDLIFSLAVSFAVGFINPYGWKNVFYLVLAAGPAATDGFVMEMQSMTIWSDIGIILAAGLCVIVLYAAKEGKNISLLRLFMSAGTWFLSILYLRNLIFLFIGTGPLLASLLNDIHYEKKERPFLEDAGINAVVFLMAATSVIYGWALAASAPTEISDSITSPVLAADWLDENADADETVLYAEYNNGAYMQYRGYKTYIDARAELHYKSINGQKDVYDEFYSLSYGTADYEAFLEEYGFTHLIVDDDSFLALYLSLMDEYELVLEGNGYEFYIAVQE